MNNDRSIVMTRIFGTIIKHHRHPTERHKSTGINSARNCIFLRFLGQTRGALAAVVVGLLVLSISTVEQNQFSMPYNFIVNLIRPQQTAPAFLRSNIFVSAMSTSSTPTSKTPPALERLAQLIIERNSGKSIVGGELATNQSKKSVSLAIAGGGSGAISSLVSTPGASSVVLEGIVTYHRQSFEEYLLNHKVLQSTSLPSNYVSKEAAILLSRAALHRSLQIIASSSDRTGGAKLFDAYQSCVGVGCTSALRSSTAKKGEHRCHVATSSLSAANNSRLYSCVLDKHLDPPRTRAQEEEVVSGIVLHALMDGNDEGILREELLMDSEHVSTDTISTQATAALATETSATSDIERAIQSIHDKECRAVLLFPSMEGDNGEMLVSPHPILPNDCIVFPGSFNPVHSGHIMLAKAAVDKVLQTKKSNSNPEQNQPSVVFEMSMHNADKPPISVDDARRRIEGFMAYLKEQQHDQDTKSLVQKLDWGILLTTSPMFAEKVEVLLHDCRISSSATDSHLQKGTFTFVIGTDTFIRIINPKYYNNSMENMLKALQDMQNRGIAFVVGGRVQQNVPTDNEENDSTNASNLPLFLGGQRELDSLSNESNVKQMFTLLTEDDFRVDISSSEIRKKGKR